MTNIVSELSALTTSDANQLIGQTIIRVEAREYGLRLTFASGAVLDIEGATYGDSALGVELSTPVGPPSCAEALSLLEVPSDASIEWICPNESNTPRGRISKLQASAGLLVAEFQGGEAGQDSIWTGSITFKRTAEVQTITGKYELVPGPKMRGNPKVVPFTLEGCFTDLTCRSFTGIWRERETVTTVYELHLDL